MNETKNKDSHLEKEKNPFFKILDWWDKLRVKPYVSGKDLNCGEGTSHPSVEVGIKISF